MNLRSRLTLVVTGVVAAAVAVGAYAAHVSVDRELGGETDRFLRERAALVARVAGPALPFGRPIDRVDPRILRNRLLGLDALTQRVTPDGRAEPLFAGQSELPVDERDLALAARGGEPVLRDVTVDGRRHRMITVPLRGGGAVQVAASVAADEAVLAGLRNRLLVIGAAGTLLAGLVAWAVSRRFTRPLEQLTRASEHVARTQDLAVPVPQTGDDEVGRLAAAFNTMLRALDTSREQQRRLVMDASHELRTPLTAVRTNIELLARARSLEAGERQALLAETSLELGELTELVNELVDLAADTRPTEPVERVNLADVAEDVAARFRRRSGRTITVGADGAVVVDARPAMVERAVSNLVDNALKFSAPDTAVEVHVSGGRVEVADRGGGVDAADRDRVFDRFYRAAGAGDRPGSGLGLAIVKQIAEVHSGTAFLREREGGGTVAVLELPAGGPPAPAGNADGAGG